MLDAAIRDRNDKAWNRAYAELVEAQYELDVATADVAFAQTDLDAVNAEITTLEATLTQQKKNLATTESPANRAAVNNTESLINLRKMESSPIIQEFARVDAIKTAAQTVRDNATTAMATA